jgi:hypothetical protein
MLNIDLLEIVSRSLSNADVVNLSVINQEMNETMNTIVSKKRVEQFARDLEDALRLVHNAKMFANREIANMMFLCEENWPVNATMNKILEKLAAYLKPKFEVEDMMYDDAEPNLTVRARIDKFVVDIWIKAGIGGAMDKPMYNWNGVAINKIDIYQERGTVLMSWTKKHAEQVTEISHPNYRVLENHDNARLYPMIFKSREYTHHIFDTFMHFDTIEMTPVMDELKTYADYVAHIAERERKIDERNETVREDSDDGDDEDSEYDSDEDEDDSGYDSEYGSVFGSDFNIDEASAYLPDDLRQHLRSIDEIEIDQNDPYNPYVVSTKRVVNTVFFEPRNIIEEIIYKTDDVVSKFLYRYQTWSTCTGGNGYIHAREDPEWFDKDYDTFVSGLKEYSKQQFRSWNFEDESDDGFIMWKFTTVVNNMKVALQFFVIEGCFSWNVEIGKYSVWIHPLEKKYSLVVEGNHNVNDGEDDMDDDGGKQFIDTGMNELFEEIGFAKSPHNERPLEHFTSEELDEIIY